MQPASSERQSLPALRRYAVWHPQSGLIVSPFTCFLPARVTANMKSSNKEDLLCPRMLEDAHVFLAFYPRKNWDNGALFSTLAIPNLASVIDQIPDSSTARPRFILRDDICQAWAELENFLLDVSQYLYSQHWDRYLFPDIDYPRWPHQCGYRDPCNTLQEMFTCLKRTQHAFRLLTAFVSFTLSLWVTQYEDDCFDRAFNVLSSRTPDPIPPIHLDYLRDSVVCRILDGLRPGGFLNPYTTKWGRAVYRFCRFRVPFWLVWGHENVYTQVSPVDRFIKGVLLPKSPHIEKVRMRQATFTWLVLPTPQDSRSFEPAPPSDLPPAPTDCFDQPLPDFAILNDTSDPTENLDALKTPTVDRTVVVDTYHAGQRPKETWEQFRARMEDSLEMRRAKETERERQAREALAKHAREQGYSKKTTVFYWEEDEVEKGFYRRIKIDRGDVDKYWPDCTEHQRFFWSHRREWDLVPHLPRYPPGTRTETPVEDLDEDDERFNFLYSKAPPRKPDDKFKSSQLSLTRIQADAAEDQSLELYTFPFPPLREYLKFRHGFSTSIIDVWHPDLHNASADRKKYCLADNKWKAVIIRLGYFGPVGQKLVPVVEEELKSVVNFHNVCVAVDNKRISCTRLPASWDLGSDRWLEQGQLRVQIATYNLYGVDKLYILRPTSSSQDASAWYVATTSATAVLLVFRKQWATTHEIASQFLNIGIPFHTVEERMKVDSPVPPYRYRPRGLGVRPKGFTPTELDYLAYLESRDNVFKSPRARVLRLRGGITGRLASEAVPDIAVLEGPSFGDEIIGSTDNTVFVDDFITESDLDIVSGVYRVNVSEGGATSADCSWWPKHGTWYKTGFHSDQWMPSAENFYQQRIELLRKKQWNVQTATKWKDSLKYDRLYMNELYGGSERLARQFIEHNL